MFCMDPVDIKAFKNRLSEYLRAAAAGETVLVTDRGQVVAELIPPRVRADASAAEQKMAELVRQGLLTPAKRPTGRLPRRRPVVKLAEVMRDLDRDPVLAVMQRPASKKGMRAAFNASPRTLGRVAVKAARRR